MALIDKIIAIADAIRANKGADKKLKLTEMPTAIGEVHNAGKKAEWDAFWDACQQNGSRTDYKYAFWNWYPAMFKPKYDMTPTACNYMFYNLFGSKNATFATSLKKVLEECGVTLDTSNCTNFQNMCAYSSITEMPVLSTVSASALQTTFDNAAMLETIEGLILKDDGSQTFTNTFRGCTKLKNIVIVNNEDIKSVIGNDLDMGDCPLTKDSFISVINALSSTASGKAVTFKKTAKEDAFTDAEWAKAIENKQNWSYAFKE